MLSDLELLVCEDMLATGYDPTLWADVVEYWNEYLNVAYLG
jgi:hypothetical protein